MVVVRRLDAVLEATKADVLAMKERLDKAKITNQEGALRNAARQAFYNASPFTLLDQLQPLLLQAGTPAHPGGNPRGYRNSGA